MSITQLILSNLRNIQYLEIEPCPNLNVIVGENGCGKTTLLEGIHILGSGRSFRTLNTQPLISFHQPYYSVFGRVANQARLGIQKMRQGEKRIKLNDKLHQSASTLAKMLPIVLINSDSYNLICGGPRHRLRFLDWGVFHVKPDFLPLWKRMNEALKHRNRALLQQLPDQEIQVWTQELVECGEKINQLREQYINQYLALFNEIRKNFFTFAVNLQYQNGWRRGVSLAHSLRINLARDRVLGYTEYGPQRADLQFRVDKQLARDILSRGQLKMLVSIMKFTQGILLQQNENKPCVYLIDDLAAELDSNAREMLIELIKNVNAQIFITATDCERIQPFIDNKNQKMFHMKHGKIL